MSETGPKIRALKYEPLRGVVVEPIDSLLPYQAALSESVGKHPFVKVVTQGLTVVLLPTQSNQIQHSLHLEILPGVTPAGLRNIAREVPDTIPAYIPITYEDYDPLRHLNPRKV